MKITKITLAFLALFVLAGCNTSKRAPNNEGALINQDETSLMREFEKSVGNTVWFAYDSSALSLKAQEELEKQACWLSRHPNIRATIEGNCDERGTREYNLALGERRATSVQKFLAQKGIERNRLSTISYGKDKPAMMGHTKEAFAYNRRAVTVVHQ